MIDLLARRPSLSPEELIADLSPSARFRGVRFENYRPNPEFPSQEEARRSLQLFLQGAQARPGGFRLFRRSRPEGRGLYLDGGKVRLNGAPARASSDIKEGDSLSAEGLGRIDFKRVVNETRRGNFKVELEVHR